MKTWPCQVAFIPGFLLMILIRSWVVSICFIIFNTCRLVDILDGVTWPSGLQTLNRHLVDINVTAWFRFESKVDLTEEKGFLLKNRVCQYTQSWNVERDHYENTIKQNKNTSEISCSSNIILYTITTQIFSKIFVLLFPVVKNLLAVSCWTCKKHAATFHVSENFGSVLAGLVLLWQRCWGDLPEKRV